MPTVGAPYSESLFIGPGGETFTRVGSFVNGSSSTWVPVWSEIGSTGRYRWVYTFLTAGLYEWSGESLSGVPVDINVQVISAAQADPAAYIAAGDIEMVSPVAESGDVTLYQSDTYDADDSRSLDWSTTDAGTWPTLTSATIQMVIRHAITGESLTASGTVTTPTGSTKAVRVELTAAQTASLDPGAYTYQVIATLSGGNVVTLATGALTVIARLS